jgi:hypothetical protein
MRRDGGGDRDHTASPGRGTLLLLDEPLAVDAVARERQRLQPLVADRLAAALAIAERSVVDLLQGGDDVPQQSSVPVAELEEELAGVGGVRLVPEILDGVVVLMLAVRRRATHPIGELFVLFQQTLLEARQSFLLHHDLPGDRES